MTANNGAAPGQKSGPAKTPTLTKKSESSPRLLRTPADPDAITSAAHAYARRGWQVLPVHAPAETPSGCSCYSERRPLCGPVGKHPVEAGWQVTPPLSGADVQATFEIGGRNVGIATGTSGFWVLDVDLDKPGTEGRLRELLAGRKLPATHTVRTPGGWHHYFAMPDFTVTNSARRLPDGVDVRGLGGMVVAPPSVSHKGAYVVATEAPDWSQGVTDDVAEAPPWLLDLVRPLPPATPVDLETLPKLTDLPEPEQRRLQAYTDRVVHAELERLDECKRLGWHGPGWNTTTFEVSCTLIELANSPWCPLTPQEAHALVLERAPTDAGFTDADVEGCFASALKTVDGKGRALPENRDRGPIYPGDPLSDPDARSGAAKVPATVSATQDTAPRAWTDLGNARRMVDLYADRLRWVFEAKDWTVYRDGAWRLEGPGAALGLVQEMVESLVDREAVLYSDEPSGDKGDKPSQRDQFIKWARAQQMSGRIDACVRQSSGRPEFRVTREAFDQVPLGDIPADMLLNCGNGVIDLSTGALHPHDPELLMMQQTPVEYDPHATAPMWEAYLARVQPDPEIRAYLQRCVGYSLTGSMAEQALFVHYGPGGSNGKSVFVKIADAIGGTYAQTTSPATLLSKREDGGHSTGVARMAGARLVFATETGNDKALDEELVKRLTGGEKVTARHLFEREFDFIPTGKVHLATNHVIDLPTGGDAMARRLRYIEWAQKITEGEKDQHLADRIIATELPGVLAWAVRGAMEWTRIGLAPPASARNYTAQRIADTDPLGRFLAEHTEKTETTLEGQTPTVSLHNAYTTWAWANRVERSYNEKTFTQGLIERGYVKVLATVDGKRNRSVFLVRLLGHEQLTGEATVTPIHRGAGA